MKPLPIILAALLAASIGAAAFEDNFGKAQAAYDGGRFAEAVLLYDGIVSNGVSNAEVHYNLANACFKDGDLPKAVWHYRTAWYRAPRDPDIRANLHFALSAAGAIDPAPGPMERALLSFSANEWIAIAVGGYLLLTLLLLLHLLLHPAGRTLLKLCFLPLAALLVAAGGWWQWREFRNRPEGVVVKSGVTALYGPVDGTTAYYKLPLAALVRKHGADPKGWIEIEYDGKTGWIKQENILPLSP